MQLNSNKDQRLLYAQANEFKKNYVILLQEELEVEELQFHLHVAHEADCEKPGEAFTAG